MKISSKLRRATLLVLAAASAWRLVGRRKRRRTGSRTIRNGRTVGHPWPEQVKNFVNLLRERGATVRDIRLERSGGKRTWVVEWNGGRTLTFPD